MCEALGLTPRTKKRKKVLCCEKSIKTLIVFCSLIRNIPLLGRGKERDKKKYLKTGMVKGTAVKAKLNCEGTF